MAAFAGMFESFGWPWELPAHFRPQILGCLAGAASILFFVKARRQAALCGAMCLVQAGLLVHAWVTMAPPGGAAARGPALRCCSFNVHTENRNFDAACDWLRAEAFDVVILLETDRGWIDAVRRLEDVYPFQIVEPRDDNFGIALLARGIPAQSHVIAPGAAGLPSVDVTFDHGLRLIGTHPLPPGRGEMVEYRDDQLAAIAGLVSRADFTVVAGDLNCAPWSHAFSRFARASGLRDTAPRWQPTWPAFWPRPMRVPIDHVLISSNLVCTGRSVGPDLGSDHLPLVFTIAPR